MPEFLGRLRTPRLSSAPTSPVVGELYFDTITLILYYWDGSAWVSTKSSSGTIYDSDFVGTVKAFSGSTVPTNWMLADGRSLSTSAYPDLFAAIGYKYGGSGANFNLPDLRSKFIYGVAQADLSDLGSGGGADTVTLTVGQIPAHSHGGVTGTDSPDHGHSGSTSTDGNHIHELPDRAFMENRAGATFSHATGGNTKLNATDVDAQTPYGGLHSHTVTVGGASARHSHSVSTEGGGGSHENLPPYIRLAQIIKVMGAQINAGGALQGATGAKGDPGPWRGAWSAATAYAVGDSVSYFDGTVTGSYRRKVAGTTAGTPKADTTNWEIIASGGSVGADGAVKVFEQAGDPGAQPVGTLWIDTDDVAPVWTQGIPLVTSLPGSPVDGQEVYYLVDATNGVIWHLRYRAASVSAYKWEMVGGPPLVAQSVANEVLGAQGNWFAAPVLTVPRNGDYLLGGHSEAYANTNNTTQMKWGIQLGDGTTAYGDQWGARSYWASTAGEQLAQLVVAPALKTGLVSGTTLKIQAAIMVGWSLQSFSRSISLLPVRIA